MDTSSRAHRPEERVLAYHEAGHAVVAVRLGVRLHEMRLSELRGSVRDGLNCGDLNPEFLSERDRKCASRKARILLAGEIAERALDVDAEVFASDDDRLELDSLAHRLFGDGPAGDEWKEAATVETKRIVVQNWRQIEALAEALISAGHLSGEEAMCVINRHSA
jgi:hypothetical protein